MSTPHPPPLNRVAVVLDAADIRAVDLAARTEDATRSAWIRRVIRKRLREFASNSITSRTVT